MWRCSRSSRRWPTGTSATRPRCSRSSASGTRSGRCYTVHFSNHTGYGAWRGPLLDPDDVREVIAGIDDRGALAAVDAVLSGYQGDPAVGAVILDAVARVKSLNPAAVYCCDPVMGDVGRGMFVRPGIPEFMRDTVVPAADILTPNHFELDFLAGVTTASMAEVLAAADVVRDRGPRDVLVTSVLVDGHPGRLARRRRGLGRRRLGGHHSPAPDLAQRLRRRHRRALPRAPHHDRLPGPRPCRSRRRACSRSSRRPWRPAPARSSWSPPRTTSPRRRSASRCGSSGEGVR